MTATIEVTDRADAVAAYEQCETCQTDHLMIIGGKCADCIAAVGLAKDTDPAPYTSWRRRVDEEVAAGPKARL